MNFKIGDPIEINLLANGGNGGKGGKGGCGGDGGEGMTGYLATWISPGTDG